MNEYRYLLSLRVRHPSQDLSVVTNTLGFAPEFFDHAGRARVRKGKVLDFISRESYWSHAFDLNAEQDIEDCLLMHIVNLEPHKELFKNIAGTGGNSELFIGFMLESFNSGFVLSPELLSKCAALNIGLSFDIYDSDKNPVAAV